MALDLRPNCELCDTDLPPNAANARICSYECTFCADCVETRLENVCPNCGGGFVPRPIRPSQAHRTGVSLAHQPASETRRSAHFTDAEVAALTARLKHIPPEDR
ncbi:MAG: urease [Ponticaulis sp.]|nr:urease [Ponticaulis sp.]